MATNKIFAFTIKCKDFVCLGRDLAFGCLMKSKRIDFLRNSKATDNTFG